LASTRLRSDPVIFIDAPQSITRVTCLLTRPIEIYLIVP
jgi:hypothetical protein